MLKNAHLPRVHQQNLNGLSNLKSYKCKKITLLTQLKQTIFLPNPNILCTNIFSKHFDETISNKPTPEFGQNQIDGTYFNIYLGYLISDEISGKAGIGTSVNRGFRYGATHTYKPTKNQTYFKTYDIEETNFEGGLVIVEENNETLDFQPIVTSLYIPTENNKIKTYLNVDYLYDNINYNELYHTIPNVEFGIENINFYFATKLSSKLGTGYFLDQEYEQTEINSY